MQKIQEGTGSSMGWLLTDTCHSKSNQSVIYTMTVEERLMTSSGFPHTVKGVENTSRNGVLLTNFKVFGKELFAGKTEK